MPTGTGRRPAARRSRTTQRWRRQRREERPADNSTDGVPSIDGRYVYQYLLDAQVRSFTQLLPNYMHVHFSDAMLVSPSRTPQDVFERRDNYYVYLSDVTVDIILKKMKFSGKPPVWIPMPPH